MKRKLKTKFKASPLFSEVQTTTQELFDKLGIKSSMSKLVMVQTVREYIENQSNPIRACNAILFKLGVDVQIKDSPRRARVYALTAVDEAASQGSNFDPKTVSVAAENRLIKIDNMLGGEVPSAKIADDTVEKKISKKEIAIEVYLKNKDGEKDDILKKLMKALDIERSAAQTYLYIAKRSLVV